MRTLALAVAIVLPLLSVERADGRETVLTLGMALEQALEQNAQILEACSLAESAGFSREIAESAFDTRVGATSRSGLGTDTQTNQVTAIDVRKRFAFGTDVALSAGTSSTDSGFYRSFVGLTVSQSLLRGFGRLVNTAPIVNAEEAEVAAARRAAAVREEVLVGVVAAYYRVVEQESLLRIATSSAGRARDLARMGRTQLSRGIVTEVDVFELETREAAAENALLESRMSLADAKDELRFLLDMELTDPVRVESRMLAIPKMDSESELVRRALDQRADLIEARAAVALAERQSEIAEKSLLPEIRVGVNVAQIGRGDSFDDSLSLNEGVVSLVLAADLPLSRRAAEAEYEISLLAVSRQQRAAARLEKMIEREVRQAFRRLTMLERRVDLQAREVESAIRAAEIARVRFERGYSTSVQLLQVQETLLQAQREQVGLEIAQLIEALRLRLSTGSLQRDLADVLPSEVECPSP